MSETLSALDATFLELEQQNEGALMSIGGVMVFDPLPQGGPPTLEDVCCRLLERLDQLPRYSQRLSSPRTGGLARPRWVTDERFDVCNHVLRAALPSPGGSAELCDWAADFYSHRLDRTRPLWEMVLLEGLEGGRWALALKTHHCLVDGVGSVDVANLLLDSEPDPDSGLVDAPAPADAGRLFQAAIPAGVQPVLQAFDAARRLAKAGAHSLRHPREGVKGSLALAELLVRDEVRPAPHTSLNVPIGTARRFAVVRVPLADLKAIRRELGGSVNDVVLSACTAGLRKLLLERDEELPRQGLRAMVPINLRAAAEHLALGNRVSSLFVELPVAEPIAQVRHQKISASTARLKRSGAGQAASTTLELAALVPPILHASLVSSVFATRLFNLTITNVPGPQAPLYAFGGHLQEIQPIVPLAADHAVGVAVFSCNGLVTFGVIADGDSTPDIATLAYGIEEGIEELRSLVPGFAKTNKLEETRI